MHWSVVPYAVQEYKPGSITLAAVDSLLPVKIIIQVQPMTEPNTACVQQGLGRDCILCPTHPFNLQHGRQAYS